MAATSAEILQLSASHLPAGHEMLEGNGTGS